MQKQILEPTAAEELVKARHAIGLYSINELRCMFATDGKPKSRYSIDMLLNTGKLKYISPNGRERFIYLNDYLAAISKIK